MIPFAVLNSLFSDVKKGSLRVNSVMILVVLLTHVELASATVRGGSYCETGELCSTACISKSQGLQLYAGKLRKHNVDKLCMLNESWFWSKIVENVYFLCRKIQALQY